MPVPQGESKSRDNEQNSTEDDVFYNNSDIESLVRLDFSERTIRNAFIRKVYGILTIQLLITVGIIALFVLSSNVKLWVQSPANSWFIYMSMFATLVVMLILAFSKDLRRKAPHNFILLAIFTIAEGIVVGTFASFFNAQAVLVAAAMTTAVCLGLTMFSFQTKYDFTALHGTLFVCLILMMLFGILAIFLPILNLVYATLGALLFSVYLVYDTQLMIGKEHQFSISPEEYIFAALNIYMDVIMIFMYILRIFASSGDS